MIGDFYLDLIEFIKRLVKDTQVLIKENTCIHDYRITYGDSVSLIKICKKCGRRKFISK